MEGLVKEYKQALRVSEGERESLQKESSAARSHDAGMTTPKRSPLRSPTPDTPSKDMVLESEPHGAEFEYFKNVLFEFLMGRQRQHLLKPLVALARFSKAQQKQVLSRVGYF